MLVFSFDKAFSETTMIMKVVQSILCNCFNISMGMINSNTENNKI